MSSPRSLGLESLDKLKEAVKERLQQEHAALSRQKLKRELLDKLDEMHKFALPPTLAEDEFKQRLDCGRGRPQGAGTHLCRRGHDRGEGARGVPRHRRAAGAAWPCARGNRREEQDHGDRGGDHARRRRARPPDPRPRAGNLGLLPEKPAGLAAIRAPIFEEKVVDFLSSLPRLRRSRSRARTSSRTTRMKRAPLPEFDRRPGVSACESRLGACDQSSCPSAAAANAIEAMLLVLRQRR